MRSNHPATHSSGMGRNEIANHGWKGDEGKQCRILAIRIEIHAFQVPVGGSGEVGEELADF